MLHLVAPAVGVDADARSAGAAEKIVNGLLHGLSDDVPERLLDAGNGAIKLERAAPLGVVVECDLEKMADVHGVATDEIAGELLDLGRNGAVAIVLAIGLTPPDDAGVGRKAHEHEILAPAGMNRQAFDALDFHGWTSWVNQSVGSSWPSPLSLALRYTIAPAAANW